MPPQGPQAAAGGTLGGPRPGVCVKHSEVNRRGSLFSIPCAWASVEALGSWPLWVPKESEMADVVVTHRDERLIV